MLMINKSDYCFMIVHIPGCVIQSPDHDLAEWRSPTKLIITIINNDNDNDDDNDNQPYLVRVTLKVARSDF